MSDLVTETTVEQGERPCRDPECSGTAEIERDGEHAYYECEECGFQFGYTKLGSEDESCAIGVPEAVRMSFSAGMEGALNAEREKRIIPLTPK